MPARLAALVLDLLLCANALAALAILATGGGEFWLGTVHVRARTAKNLLLLLLVLLPLRFRFGDRAILGLSSLHPQRIAAWAARLCSRLDRATREIPRAPALRIVTAGLLLSALVKILNAWFYYGFYSGDDVEIHEMTFARLFQRPWQAWELRSPLYPFLFLYPAQAAALALGLDAPGSLVFAGRLVVVSFSSWNLWLLYRIGAREGGSPGAGLWAFFFLATNQLHTRFASSELPRTIASTFLLLCVGELLRRPPRAHRTALASLWLAVSAALRFSESIFLLPALILLFRERRTRAALALGVAAPLVALSLLAVADALYGRPPLASLRAVVDYTLIEGRSSRGYQPAHWYLSHLGRWTNPFAAGLALYAAARRPSWALAWLAVPVAVLSLLPHKEERYLVPVLPFLALLAGEAARDLVARAARARSRAFALWFLYGLVGATLLEVDGFRFRRSEAAVDVARALVRHQAESVAIQDPWKAGGRLYLATVPRVEALAPEDLRREDFLRSLLARRDLEYLALATQLLERAGIRELFAAEGLREVPLPRSTGSGGWALFERPAARSGRPGLR